MAQKYDRQIRGQNENAQEGRGPEQLVLEGGQGDGAGRPGNQRQVEALVDVAVQQVRQRCPLGTADRCLIRLATKAMPRRTRASPGCNGRPGCHTKARAKTQQ